MSLDSARNYMRLYRATHSLPPKGQTIESRSETESHRKDLEHMLKVYEKMTRSQLIAELIKEKGNR